MWIKGPSTVVTASMIPAGYVASASWIAEPKDGAFGITLGRFSNAAAWKLTLS